MGSRVPSAASPASTRSPGLPVAPGRASSRRSPTAASLSRSRSSRARTVTSSRSLRALRRWSPACSSSFATWLRSCLSSRSSRATVSSARSRAASASVRAARSLVRVSPSVRRRVATSAFSASSASLCAAPLVTQGAFGLLGPLPQLLLALLLLGRPGLLLRPFPGAAYGVLPAFRPLQPGQGRHVQDVAVGPGPGLDRDALTQRVVPLQLGHDRGRPEPGPSGRREAGHLLERRRQRCHVAEARRDQRHQPRAHRLGKLHAATVSPRATSVRWVFQVSTT